MRLVIITQDDPVYLGTFFRKFLKELGSFPWLQVKGIFVNSTFRNDSRIKLLNRIYPLYGIRGIVILSIKYELLKLWKMIPVCFRRKNIRVVEDAKHRYGIPVKRENNVNGDEFITRLRALKPDLVLSVSASQIFKKDLLETPKFGCINIHCGKLPMYRGMLPSFWQMLRGEDRITITVHYMGERIDDGEVIREGNILIDPSLSLDEHIHKAKEESVNVLLKVLEQFETGKTESWLPSTVGACYYSFPDAIAASEFRKRGLRVI